MTVAHTKKTRRAAGSLKDRGFSKRCALVGQHVQVRGSGKAAGWVGSNAVHRVRPVGWAGRARRRALHIRARDVAHLNRRAIRRLVVHRPLLFGRVDLLEIGDARAASAALSGTNKVRNGDRH